MMSNEIPMIETRFPAIMMGNPSSLRNILVDLSLSGNSSKAFVLTGCKIEVHSSTPEMTQCSGLFCDKQRIH